MSTSDDEEDVQALFREPDDYLLPEKPFTYESFKLKDGRSLHLRLVGNNPLWGHLLWNGARRLSQYLQQPEMMQRLIQDKNVLELGAGAGLPSLICALQGAAQVVVTDYPDAELIDNLRHNVESCQLLPTKDNIVAEGYLWGADTASLTQHLSNRKHQLFDTLLMADLLFNHSEHTKLVRTVRQTLARTKEARALVFFTPYRPWLLQKDLDFFRLSTERDSRLEHGNGVDDSLGSNKLFEELLPKAMFEKDPGDETLRRTVFGYELYWTDLQ